MRARGILLRARKNMRRSFSGVDFEKEKIDGTAIFFTILFIVAGIGLICGTLSAKRNYERDFVRVEAVVIGNWEREPEDPFEDDWLYLCNLRV